MVHLDPRADDNSSCPFAVDQLLTIELKLFQIMILMVFLRYLMLLNLNCPLHLWSLLVCLTTIVSALLLFINVSELMKLMESNHQHLLRLTLIVDDLLLLISNCLSHLRRLFVSLVIIVVSIIHLFTASINAFGLRQRAPVRYCQASNIWLPRLMRLHCGLISTTTFQILVQLLSDWVISWRHRLWTLFILLVACHWMIMFPISLILRPGVEYWRLLLPF